MSARLRAAFFLALVLAAARVFAQAGGNFEIRQGTIVAGGGSSAAADSLLAGTLGQADAGQLRGGRFRLNGGIWPALYEVTAAPCLGDCGGDGQVTVDELVEMVGISIAGTPPAECESGDGNGDGRVSVDELIAAVHHALAACS